MMTTNKAEIAGVLRALIPAAVAYAAGKGIDLSFLAQPEIVAALATLLCVGSSIRAKRAGRPPKAPRATPEAQQNQPS
jgi:hypothetical protein